jgi:hypothetical protein
MYNRKVTVTTHSQKEYRNPQIIDLEKEPTPNWEGKKPEPKIPIQEKKPPSCALL